MTRSNLNEGIRAVIASANTIYMEDRSLFITRDTRNIPQELELLPLLLPTFYPFSLSLFREIGF
jgi:hypothetical protein